MKCEMCASACVSWCDKGSGSSGACSHCTAEISTEGPVVPPRAIHPRPRNRIAEWSRSWVSWPCYNISLFRLDVQLCQYSSTACKKKKNKVQNSSSFGRDSEVCTVTLPWVVWWFGRGRWLIQSSVNECVLTKSVHVRAQKEKNN